MCSTFWIQSQKKIIAWIKEIKKLDSTKNLWYLFLRNFKLLWSKSYFWKRDWALGSASSQLWDSPDIAKFPKTLSITLLGNLWGSLYTKFIILEIKSCFTCGELNLYQCVKLFHYIISTVFCKKNLFLTTSLTMIKIS